MCCYLNREKSGCIFASQGHYVYFVPYVLEEGSGPSTLGLKNILFIENTYM